MIWALHGDGPTSRWLSIQTKKLISLVEFIHLVGTPILQSWCLPVVCHSVKLMRMLM